ncbi:MAG TPA: CsgG/HfaB family protein [Myxococcales bacterium]|nr:CsgG/HfaB family protein [Myxococcales bacterium]
MKNPVLGAFSAGLLCACGTVAVRVPVMRPAEINMAPYQSVAIGEMTGAGNRPMTDSIEEALVNTNRFTVVDRQHLASVMRELHLSSTDLADPNAAARLGKVVTAGALIFGDVQHSYREQPDENRYKDDKGVHHTWYSVKGETYVRATFKIVDVSTGRLIVAKTYEERRDDTNRGLDRRPEPIDRIALENSARRAVVERFMKAIVPHQEYMLANFQKDSDIPQLEGGIGWAERGDWKKAQGTFNDAAQDSEKNVKLKAAQIAKCYWNLGLSYEYAGDYEKGEAMINKAYTLSNDREMLAEIDNIHRLQADAQKLAEQNASPGIAGAR